MQIYKKITQNNIRKACFSARFSSKVQNASRAPDVRPKKGAGFERKISPTPKIIAFKHKPQCT